MTVEIKKFDNLNMLQKLKSKMHNAYNEGFDGSSGFHWSQGCSKEDSTDISKGLEMI